MLAASSELRLPSSEGVELMFGTRKFVVDSFARACGESRSLEGNGGTGSALADCILSMVGHADGDGITSDGRLSRLMSFLDKSCLTELDTLRGTMAESSSDTSYRSSKSVVRELALSRAEEPEVEYSDEAVEYAGDGDREAACRGGRRHLSANRSYRGRRSCDIANERGLALLLWMM